ncbi:MAG TPA: 3-methyl-2-oxobutanoate hydroxymethyltransferase [Firmicutes bacterium]|uniref:3-methyl-2-oxobutanoate hydroxymethyltransferase n=1 Tax=Candidatus Coatesbacteria bacterium 4484_99 TaxID=1970774 RepID=A0A1W9S1M0_9BACT|nr:MAG: 3-methyl-2-oxobutanoate hydroxymethyltransferase [Candidatus Coatesbacteria bacterium 4484_99]RLC42700.1 MAG: 3-methyl-2-oxobutanoate hydroxymethyltransferase [Candidatus Coatesbacteria bacterium]RLC42717.1 MAG: 3-methyl-2-oxobutanoate hydroxymethyltransferase [Candidatus Coatesbacteria bacterium]HDM43364.1 3-methyl-2-oxobutanoate hydroxymethyltransferase [Bacillota bacterium]HEC80537.1 3-methyl-2-oxobutanoate hydroxymethyltransferase [Bacillota bacterium]
MNEKITIGKIQAKKGKEPIVAITAYDAPTGAIVDEAGVDLILVGDSAGMVVLGYETTLPVELNTMLTFSQAVARGVKKAHICFDMPFMTYHISIEDGLRNCGRAIKEGCAESVKIEGARVELVRALVECGIPVLGHLGFTPQSIHQLGGYRVVGKMEEEAERLIEDSIALEKAGAYALVLETVPEEISEIITKELKIPTIGIGAGRFCDGQIIVLHDIIGLYKPTPRHARLYRDVHKDILKAVREYSNEVRTKSFPQNENITHLTEEILKKIRESRNKR